MCNINQETATIAILLCLEMPGGLDHPHLRALHPDTHSEAPILAAQLVALDFLLCPRPCQVHDPPVLRLPHIQLLYAARSRRDPTRGERGASADQAAGLAKQGATEASVGAGAHRET
jgi:hypothetical protein